LENGNETFIELIFVFGLERRLATWNIVTVNLDIFVKGAHGIANFFESDGGNQRLLS